MTVEIFIVKIGLACFNGFLFREGKRGQMEVSVSKAMLPKLRCQRRHTSNVRCRWAGDREPLLERADNPIFYKSIWIFIKVSM